MVRVFLTDDRYWRCVEDLQIAPGTIAREQDGQSQRPPKGDSRAVERRPVRDRRTTGLKRRNVRLFAVHGRRSFSCAYLGGKSASKQSLEINPLAQAIADRSALTAMRLLGRASWFQSQLATNTKSSHLAIRRSPPARADGRDLNASATHRFLRRGKNLASAFALQ